MRDVAGTSFIALGAQVHRGQDVVQLVHTQIGVSGVADVNPGKVGAVAVEHEAEGARNGDHLAVDVHLDHLRPRQP